MGLLDKLKRIRNQADEDLDDLDGLDLDLDDDGDDTPPAPSGGGVMGRAMGFLKREKRQASDDDDDEDGEVNMDGIDDDDADDAGNKTGGRLGGLLSRVIKIKAGKKKSKDQGLDDDDEDSEFDILDSPVESDDEQPIRRSGIAAALDGDPEKDKPSGDAEEEPGRGGALAGLGLDLESLFEEEFVFDPTLKDLAESLDDVSAVELAADLRSFLDELQ
ncbi:MAG: hypothetical protein IH872_08875 [Chloroflexi bacterium]|nr:hypothetical protein [Chloroflexota bacterium]